MTPVSIAHTHALTIGDFVVFKLDIDVSHIEEKVLTSLVELDMLPMVGELFTEVHYDAPEITSIFPHSKSWVVPWAHAINMFHSLRQQGLRIHYWP